MKTAHHIDAGNFENLEKILESWVKLNEKYVRSTDEDAPWWYNERASISILAAATWQAGGIALEEFSTRKKERGKSERAGRTDVFLKIGETKFACEAKFVWLRMGKSDAKAHIIQIKQELKNARADARHLNPEDGKRFGVCFASVRIPEKCESKINEILKEFQKEIRSANFEALAWSFPLEARKLGFQKPSWKHKYFYPGSFIIFHSCD